MLFVAVPLSIITLAIDILERAPALFRVLDELAHVFIAIREGEGPAPVHLVVLPVWSQPVS